MTIKTMCFDFVLNGLNHGIVMCMAGAVLLLLYPLLKKLLPPQVRCYLWSLFFAALLAGSNGLPLFPVGFEDLVSTRSSQIVAGFPPAFLPGEYRGEGGYHAALPGGALVRFELRDWLLWALFFLWLAGIVVILYLFYRRKKALWALTERSRRLEKNDPLLQEKPFQDMDAVVWVCPDLPTSFVYRTPIFWGRVENARPGFQIFLQEELSDQRLKLVLLHELRHISIFHCWWKGWATLTLVLNWWNPVAWPVYFLLCRDLELACDRSVMKRLDQDQRREYAHTLVELGAGKQMWDAPLSFCECDGALRVKAIASWKPRRWWWYIPAVLLVLILSEFLWGGQHWKEPPVQDMPLAWERETGSADNFAKALGREMAEKLYQTWKMDPEDPRVLEVREAWEAPEEYPWTYMWVLDGGGNWYCVEYSWWAMDAQWVGVTEVNGISAPDLTNSTPIYRG